MLPKVPQKLPPWSFWVLTRFTKTAFLIPERSDAQPRHFYKGAPPRDWFPFYMCASLDFKFQRTFCVEHLKIRKKIILKAIDLNFKGYTKLHQIKWLCYIGSSVFNLQSLFYFSLQRDIESMLFTTKVSISTTTKFIIIIIDIVIAIAITVKKTWPYIYKKGAKNVSKKNNNNKSQQNRKN